MTDTDHRSASGLPGSPERGLQILLSAFENVPEAVFVVRPDGREIVACNPAAERMFGYPFRELLGRSTEALHVDRARYEEFRRVSAETLGRRETFHIDWEMRRRDGTVFPTSHTVSQIDEALGLGGGVVSLVRDRSDLAEVASRLDELETHYRVLFEENPEAMAVYGAETGRMLAVNRSLAALYGGEPRSLIGRPVGELLVEDERPKVRELLGQPHPAPRRVHRWRVRRHDGTLRTLRSTSNPVTFEGQPARLVVLTDITERLEAESFARRLLAILDATPDFVGISDRDERVEYVNPSGLRLVGWPGEDARDATVSQFMSPASLALLRREGYPTALSERVWTGETYLRHRDGTEIPVSQVVIHHHDREDDTSYLSTIARDMREHHRLEEQLRQSQKMDAIGRLAGGIAHDFNNLLTTLIGYAELTLLQADDPEAVREHAGEILTGARRAADLTGQLLAFGRRQTLETRVVDLDRMVRETEAMLRRTLEETVDLRIEPSGGRVRTDGDPARLHQVLLNLVLNARDAMPDGGTLWIETDCVALDESRHVDGTTVPPGDYAVLRVRDTGIGMSPEVKSQIFEPFFTTKGAGEGTGLGLSTVYGIVQQSGGCTEVESEPGRGSTFTVYLPLSEREPEPEETTASPTQTGATATGTVLLAEDDEGVREFLRTILEAEGHTVLAADCAFEALDLRSGFDRPIDLLLTDVVLPRMDGRRLAEQLRELDPELPVIFISGYSYEAAGGRAPEEGTAFLQKPFSAQEILSIVREILDRPAS